MNSEETVSEPFSAAVTMKVMEHEYNIVLDELGGVILVEGPDAELAASLVEQGKSLDESIKLLGITPGKVRLIEKLAASGTQEIKYEDWATKSVKEIMSATKTVKTESLKAGKSVIQKDSKVQSKAKGK